MPLLSKTMTRPLVAMPSIPDQDRKEGDPVQLGELITRTDNAFRVWPA
jgi:hypothetical protein